MKRLSYLVLFLFILINVVACSSPKTNDNNATNSFLNYHTEGNISPKDSSTKIYYAENQYVSFSLDSTLSVEFNDNDIVVFNDGTAMAKLYSVIKIYPTSSSYKLINGNNYINFESNVVFTKISTGSKTYSLEDIDLSNFKIVDASLITPVFEEFFVAGGLIYVPEFDKEGNIKPVTIKTQNDNIYSANGTIFYAYFNEKYTSDKTKNDIKANIELDFSTIETNSCNIINLYFDLLAEIDKYLAFTIIKTDKSFYFIEMKYNNEGYYEMEDPSENLDTYVNIHFIENIFNY